MSESITEREAFALLAEMVEEYERHVSVAATMTQAPWSPTRWDSASESPMMLQGIDFQGDSPYVARHAVASRESLQDQEFRVVMSHLARQAAVDSRQRAADERAAHQQAGGTGPAVVRGAPSGRAGMVSRVDTTWHGRGPHGRGQTEQGAYRATSAVSRPLASSTRALGHGGAPCVACRRGKVYKLGITGKMRRKVRRLLPRIASGKASNAMRLEFVELLREVSELR